MNQGRTWEQKPVTTTQRGEQERSPFEEAWRTRQENFSPTIGFDYPLRTLVVSLTGDRCELDCAHCGGHYLEHMVPIWEADPQGATSCLISGGCDRQGRVPVTQHLDLVERLRPGRVLNWHVGLIGRPEAEAIAPYVDIISFDFVGDEETIREVYGLEVGVEAYVAAYELLRSQATVVPHITVGLRGGRLSGEYHALETLQELGVDGLVFIVFIPTPGTRYAHRQPPAPEEVAALLAEARLRFPGVPVHLGCMRPSGSYRDRLDPLAVRAGVNVIVSPSGKAVRLVQELGLRVDRREECCAVRFKREEQYG
jgi:uncharacterized radical SAM superfamily protein